MAHELIISGGSVVDGTGADAVKADVAIDGDRITRVGDLTGTEAARTIDATGIICFCLTACAYEIIIVLTTLHFGCGKSYSEFNSLDSRN